MNSTPKILRLGVLALLLTGGSGHVTAANLSAVNEVTKLKNAGVSDNVITNYIQSKSFNFDLSADDIVALHQQGLSQPVINAMLASGRSAAAPVVPAPVPAAPTPPSFAPAPASAAPATLSPDAAYFYQELSPYGRWLMAEDGQWYWQPSFVATTPGWRPYYDNGYWSATDAGWYWTSDYPWAWAAFHYGRWQLHPHLGWIWLPDRVWGPAWVVWRGGGDYCGWAPLPPGAVFDVGSGRFRFNGRFVEAGFDFGLDWMRFNFCYVKELGQPFHWHPRGDVEIRSVFDRTRLITSFRVGRSVINGETRSHFVNVGVEPARVGELRGRPVEVMKLQDARAPSEVGGHEKVALDDRTIKTYRPGFGKRDDKRRDAGR